MRTSTAFVLALVCMLGLIGCGQTKQIPPEVDLDAPIRECWPGRITDIFTSGSGSDLAEVIKLEIKDHAPMYFTIVADTAYWRYDSDTEETEQITREDLYIGAWVEIDCESFHNSDYHPIFAVKLIEPAAEDAYTLEVMENTVSGIGRGTLQTAVALSQEDAKTLSEILDRAAWTEGTTDCSSDCVINLKGHITHYHSDCGTFNKFNLAEMSPYSSKELEITGKSCLLSEEDRTIVNAILEAYITLSATSLEHGE